MSICVSNERQGCLHFREHMALLRRAERPTTHTINITLLRRGGRKMVKLRTLLNPGENDGSLNIRPDIHASSCLPCFFTCPSVFSLCPPTLSAPLAALFCKARTVSDNLVGRERDEHKRSC